MHIPETFEEKGGFLNNQAQTQAQRGVSRAACELVLACFSKARQTTGLHILRVLVSRLHPIHHFLPKSLTSRTRSGW